MQTWLQEMRGSQPSIGGDAFSLLDRWQLRWRYLFLNTTVFLVTKTKGGTERGSVWPLWRHCRRYVVLSWLETLGIDLGPPFRVTIRLEIGSHGDPNRQYSIGANNVVLYLAFGWLIPFVPKTARFDFWLAGGVMRRLTHKRCWRCKYDIEASTCWWLIIILQCRRAILMPQKQQIANCIFCVIRFLLSSSLSSILLLYRRNHEPQQTPSPLLRLLVS